MTLLHKEILELDNILSLIRSCIDDSVFVYLDDIC